MSTATLKIAGIQYHHQQGQRDHNLEAAATMMRTAPGHDLYVLPELNCSGYGAEAFARLDELAEDDQGPSHCFFAELARELNAHICYSFPKRHPAGITIHAAVVNNEGTLVCAYDKWHVCQFGECAEKDYFIQGQGGPPVFTIGAIRIGLAICYDIRFPEMMRTLTVNQGISVLLHPGGWPLDEGLLTWHPFAITRAVENGIYIMSVNRAGDHNGNSIWCPPFMDLDKVHPTRLGTEEGVLSGTVDIAHLANIRKTVPFLTDRRPDRYDACAR